MDDSPVDIVLHCPRCHMQHIDQPESESAYTGRLFESSWWELGGDKPERWTNPPHRSHLCRKEEGGCGTVWRPADVPTNGVRAVSRGKADTWPDGVRVDAPAEREQTLAGLLKRCARCLPPDHATRKLATDYLKEQGFFNVLRTPGVKEDGNG